MAGDGDDGRGVSYPFRRSQIRGIVGHRILFVRLSVSKTSIDVYFQTGLRTRDVPLAVSLYMVKTCEKVIQVNPRL